MGMYNEQATYNNTLQCYFLKTDQFYYYVHRASQFNWTKFSEWITTAEIPPVQYMDIFYQLLVKSDYKVVIITGLEESFKSIIEANLARLGIDNWFKLAFK